MPDGHSEEFDKDVGKALLDLSPSSSKKKQQRPYTPKYIKLIQKQLDLNVPLDTSVNSCLLTTFYTAAQV